MTTPLSAPERAARHYDRVTEVWQKFIMGDELHFGFFRSNDETLAQATRNLTDHLIAAAQLTPGQSVLDVGCGIGTVAVRLAESEGCMVTGLTTSSVGLELAAARALDHHGRVRFVLADAVRSGLPSQAFDRVFALESAHLIDDPDALFAEWHRLLRPNGRVAMCDVTLVDALDGRLSEVEGYRALGHARPVAERMQAAIHGAIHRAFGSSRLRQATRYLEAARAAGFSDVKLKNISSPTRATLARWAQNAHDHAGQIEASLGPGYLDDFFLAVFHMSLGWGRRGGYVVLTAHRQ